MYNAIVEMRKIKSRPPLLMVGSRGWWVKMLYRLLDAQECYTAPPDVPALYSAITEALVIGFQRAVGLAPSGAVDAQTWAALATRRAMGERVVRLALTEAYDGAREIGGNNMGPWVKKYTGGKEGPKWPWCVAFSTWCQRIATDGRSLLKQRYSTSMLYAEAVKRGFITTNPQPGDLALIKRKGAFAHTALVSHVEDENIWVVEGNVRPRKWMPWQYDVVRVGVYPRAGLTFVKLVVR